MPFYEVTGRYSGPHVENEVLAFWREHNIFGQTMAQSQGRLRFSFNEGPPTANGKPGIHHVLARAFKDAFPRYKTMKGYHVPRKAGWDTHGLPVEHEIEKKLGIFDKKEIEAKVGVGEFTRLCRESVMQYIDEWEQMTERMGFWVNLDEAYYTLDNDYIESVWHLLKTIWDKHLIYQGYKVVPYDPRIGTTLSSHELAQGYREVDDPSVTVRFKLLAEDVSLLVWTTTPWTLPSNLALAVGSDIEYVFVECKGETLLLADVRREAVLGEREHRVIQRIRGSELVGKRYKRLFDYLHADGDICRILPADFVNTEDGTGIVHIAPAYGVDDLALGQQHGLPVVHGVGLDGNFKPEVEPVAGMFFKDADPVLIELLRERGDLFNTETVTHQYPFGWRTGDPLIYYAKNAWYIRTTAVADRMVELNTTINWIPESIRDGRFGNWLENNVDWALSRERFWGTPLPLWTDGEGNYRCIGSLAELEERSNCSLSDVDLHRPSIDKITFEEDGRTWTRVEEVIDCWFDSGAMSYAQWHYPFENSDSFEQHFPADFICEAIDQTRGWFYTLHAIATLVSDSVAFKNCICLSHVVDEHGKKMSKSKGNIVDPYDVFESVGADPLRWYFLARQAPDVQKRISVDIVAEVAASFVNTLWNTYSFFVMYANLDQVNLDDQIPVEKRAQIDQWAAAKLHHSIASATNALDHFDAKTAGNVIEHLVDQLSNWYVRRNRRRFWKADAGTDKQAAYLTLYECLVAICKLTAPFMPFISESLYQNLVRRNDNEAPLSVHMACWPETDTRLVDKELIHDIDVVQKVVGLGRAARELSKVRVRQPLSRLLLRTPTPQAENAVREHAAQIEDELNIKQIEFLPPDAELLNYRIKPKLPELGKRYGKMLPMIRKALAECDGTAMVKSHEDGQAFSLDIDGQSISFSPEDVLVETESAEGYACAEQSGYLVGLDTRLTDALLAEGLARELVRTVQDARKQAGLDVANRITLRIEGTPDVDAALVLYRNHVMDETLATAWGDESFKGQFSTERKLDNNTWTITIQKRR